jgi:hypothetical protein
MNASASQASAAAPDSKKLIQQTSPAKFSPAWHASTGKDIASGRAGRCRAARIPPPAIQLLTIRAPSNSVNSQLASA